VPVGTLCLRRLMSLSVQEIWTGLATIAAIALYVVAD